MTSTKPGAQVGGYRNEVDQQKLAPALVITAGLILGMRTIRWEATHSDGLAGEEWEKEVEHSARVAKRMLTYLTDGTQTYSNQRRCRGMSPAMKIVRSSDDRRSPAAVVALQPVQRTFCPLVKVLRCSQRRRKDQ